MVAYQRELLCQVAGDVDDLLLQHYAELCGRKEQRTLAPRWDQYAALEQAGLLFVVTAREGAALVGYACFFVDAHMHYRDLCVATNDVLFLHQDHRKGRTGLRLIARCEQVAADLGADHIVWRAKEGTVLRDLLPSQGYELEEVALGKPITRTAHKE